MNPRNAFNYDTDQASLDTGLSCGDGTKTQQQFRDDADINVIVRRFGVTGVLPTNGRMPVYDDFSEVGDYHTAVNAVRAATEAFMALPARVRQRFEHDPQRFVDFCSDPANLDEARKLGLSPDVPPPDIHKIPNPPAPPVEPKGGYPAPAAPPSLNPPPAP
ncbi:MAG: internal scaffolding protein [Microviridae sp.]|nr:MAG: internal scaffolding protein [Microviridae sp.]